MKHITAQLLTSKFSQTVELATFFGNRHLRNRHLCNCHVCWYCRLNVSTLVSIHHLPSY